MPPTRRKRSARNTNQAEESNSAGPSRNSTNENVPRRTRSRSAGAEKENPQKKRKTQAAPPPVAQTSPPPLTEAIIRRSSDGKVRDIFCWMCHKIGGEISCESCPRLYHIDCLEKLNNKCNLNVKCECNFRSVDGKYENLNWDSNCLKRMLQYVMERAMKPDEKSKTSKAMKKKFSQYFHTWLGVSEKLCKVMDIAILIDNMNGEGLYSSTGQFFLDVKWLYHNCYIYYGADHEFTDLAKKFENTVKLELTDLEVCLECYRTKVIDQHADYFTRVCSKRHEIIWAKLRGSPFWPAKCMDIQNGHADVRFFASHDRANIMAKNCFKISRRHPFNKKIAKPQYQEALRELSIYVSNYKVLHGNFDFHEPNTPLDLDDDSPKKTSKNIQKTGQSNTLNRRPSTMVPENGESEDDDEAINNTAVNGQILPSSTEDSIAESRGAPEKNKVRRQNSDSEPTEKKTSLSLHCVNNFNENERDQNISEFISEGGVTYASEFTAEHEHSEPIENLYMPQTSLNPTMPTLESPVQSTANLMVARTDMDENLISCPSTVSSSVLNKESLPVIASTHSSAEIPHGSQMVESNSVNSLPIIASTSSAAGENIDFRPRRMSALTAREEMQMTDPQTPNSSLFMSSLREQMQNFVAENNLHMFGDEIEPEEEIQVISEEAKTHSIMKNPAIVKAVAEILLATKPNMKNLLIHLQEKLLFVFISIFMDSYYARFDTQDIKLFVEICNKLFKKIQNLEKDNLQLRKDNKKLQDNVTRLEEEKENKNRLDRQKIMLKDVIIQKASERLRRSDCEELQLLKFKETEKSLAQEIGNLQSKLQEANQKLEFRDIEIKNQADRINNLKIQIAKFTENMKNLKSVEVQTDPKNFETVEVQTDTSISQSTRYCVEELASEDQQESSLMDFSPDDCLRSTDSETGSSEGQQTFTQTIQRTKISIHRETVSEILVADDDSQESGLMANFQQALMPPNVPAFLATPSPLLPLTIVPQGPIILDSENSASFLEATIQEPNLSSNLQGVMKTYPTRKKKNN